MRGYLQSCDVGPDILQVHRGVLVKANLRVSIGIHGGMIEGLTVVRDLHLQGAPSQDTARSSAGICSEC